MPDAHRLHDHDAGDHGDHADGRRAEPRSVGARHVSATEFRQNLARHLDQVRDSRAPLVVTRQGEEGVVVLAEGEWAALQETLHVLGTPANARRLLDAIAEFEAGKGVERDLIEP